MLKHYKRIILQLFVIVSFFVFQCAFSQTNTAAEQLTVLLQGFRTYQADFTQVTYGNNNQVMQRSRGNVMIKRPNGFRWETDTPTKQILITNGVQLWVYDVDLAQVTERPVDDRSNVNPAVLLSGSKKELMQDFSVDMVPQALSGRNHFSFLLRPKKQASFKWVQLDFHAGQLVTMKIFNNLGETSIFNFIRIKLNAPLATRLFNFKPPEGVDVVRQ